jgi:hypothetical protein
MAGVYLHRPYGSYATYTVTILSTGRAQPRGGALGQETPDRLAPAVAHVPGLLGDVHAAVVVDALERRRPGAGALGVGLSERERVADGLVPAGHRVPDGLAEERGDVGDGAGAVLEVEAAMDGVDAQGQLEADSLLPPLAHIEDELEPGVGEGELAFVDDQAGVGLAAGDGGDDLVKGELPERRDRPDARRTRPSMRKAVVALAGDGDGDAGAAEDVGLAGDELGAEAVAEAGAAGCDDVPVLHIGPGADRERGDVQSPISTARRLRTSISSGRDLKVKPPASRAGRESGRGSPAGVTMPVRGHHMKASSGSGEWARVRTGMGDGIGADFRAA